MTPKLWTATFLVSTALATAHAADTPPGEILGSFESPNQVSEFCSAPRALDLDATLASGASAYRAFRDFEAKSAKETCRSDFYDRRESSEAASATVLCPKVGSTNPAVMLHALPNGMSRAEFIAKECPKEHGRAGDLIGKFKQSVSCSYTPSILSYPRVGEMLRSEIEMPFTVYRSMDRRAHLDFAASAKDLAAKVGGQGSLIAQTWRTIYADDADPAASPRRAGLYRDGDSVLFGSIVPDTPGDEIYWEANGSARGDRVANFQKTAAFAMVTSPSAVPSWGLPRTFSVPVAQKLVLLREMGDLIVLDTLLNQQDRFGNLHFRPHYLRVEADGSFDWKLAKKKRKSELDPDEAKRAGKEFIPDPKQAAELSAKGYLLLSRMLLADNDCGVAKENRMAEAGIASKLAHLHPDTYAAVQKLQALARKGMLAGYLKSELLFTDRDVRSVQANLAGLAAKLKERCLAGQLRLDADLAQYLGIKPAVDSVAFCKAN